MPGSSPELPNMPNTSSQPPVFRLPTPFSLFGSSPNTCRTCSALGREDSPPAEPVRLLFGTLPNTVSRIGMGIVALFGRVFGMFGMFGAFGGWVTVFPPRANLLGRREPRHKITSGPPGGIGTRHEGEPGVGFPKKLRARYEEGLIFGNSGEIPRPPWRSHAVRTPHVLGYLRGGHGRRPGSCGGYRRG